MKIGIDISQIIYKGTGVGRFTDGLVKAILQYDNKNQWLFFFSSLRKNLDEELEKKILQQGHKIVKWKIPPTFLALLWNNFHQFSKYYMSNIPYFNELDWFISSDWSEPPLKINKTTIVHDLVFKRYPQTVDKKIKFTQEKRLNWVKKESKIIFTDSKATKEDLINYLKIDPKKIIINYPGVDVVNINKILIDKTLKKYKLRKNEFVLTVGKLEPRKNLERLIDAWRKIKNKNLKLVIVGQAGWGKIKNIKNQIANIKNIKHLDYISNSELYSLYASSLFFIFPSIWEGFGYPIIEAMKLATPVVCSNNSSIKEIADEAALFFNPNQTKDMIEKIKIMIKDKKLRKKLVTKGKQRCKIFSWKNYFNQMINALLSDNQ